MAYISDRAIHPGHVLSRTLESEGMTQKSLCDRTGISEKHISQIIHQEASITVHTALLLENVLGGAASFWINLEKNYQETKVRAERAALLKAEVSLLNRFPYAELVKRNCVEATAKREEKVENLWKFFGVNSLTYVSNTEAIADFRLRESDTEKQGVIAAWLRCGELESKKEEVAAYSKAGLKNAVDRLRALTCKDPKVFSKEAKDVLRACGVSLVYVPHFTATGVSGAVRWVGDNPVIQLSLLGGYADIFWFNLFHEIGHVLLHGKKEKFIEYDKGQGAKRHEKEREADAFAGDALIPNAALAGFLEEADFSKVAVAEFAKTIGIHPGVVEGRLCHERDTPITWDRPLGFRERLGFAGG